MRRSLSYALLVAGVIASTALQFSRLRAAEDDLRSAMALRTRIEQQVADVARLRNERQVVADRRRPERDVLAHVNAAMAEAGLPSEAFGSLEQESDAPWSELSRGTSNRLRVQSVSLALTKVSANTLGRFLDAWERRGTLWSVQRIELTHSRSNTSEVQEYGASLQLASVYLSDGMEDSR